MTSADAVIRTDALVKTFGPVRALDGLDLEVRPGEVHGFLGPNGAGKSTTIRVVLGLLKATSGHVELFGGDPWHDATRLHARLAYVPGDVSLWPGLTGGECLDVLGAVHGRVQVTRRDELIDRFDLDPTKRIRDYSKGNRQKVALIAALAADVDLLVLDEPTSGLDPLMEQCFQVCVRQRRQQGCAVLLSSHILGEVEALADRVSIIRRGRTVTTGSLTDLRRHTRTTVHAVTVDDPAGLATAPGVAEHTVERLDGCVESRFSIDAEHLDDVVGRLHAARIQTLSITPPNLNALFLRSYRDVIDAHDAVPATSAVPTEATR
jgi:ABC-2 type transport system ATP-binding protein